MIVSTHAQNHSRTGPRPLLSAFVCALCFACGTGGPGDTETTTSDSDGSTSDGPEETRYTLFTPFKGTISTLADPEGVPVNTWTSTTPPAVSVFLLPGGDLLRTGVEGTTFISPGVGGRIERQSWDGDPLWSFTYSDQDHRLHHDIEPLANGNILALAWEQKSAEEASAAGRDPATIDPIDDLWPDTVIEIDPQTNTIVWQWHVWDHLVQNFDANAPNYGDPNTRPERIDLNFVDLDSPALADWNHFNGIGYNQDLDQIVISAHHFSEIWVIDHSTTTAEAATSSGGRSGRGGDLLYRWGNPAAYGADGAQQLYHQHDPRWIPEGLPGAGDLTIFNNGDDNLRPYSTVIQITTPIDDEGNYLFAGGSYGPAAPNWQYTAEPKESFYSRIMGSAQRLPNGNTLINEGLKGRFFIVDPEGKIISEKENGISIFRADSFAADSPELSGRELTPTEG